MIGAGVGDEGRDEVKFGEDVWSPEVGVGARGRK